MARAMIPLHRRMQNADRVHIKSPATDLSFSISALARNVRACSTFPMAKCFPARSKLVNGVIQFNTPTIYFEPV